VEEEDIRDIPHTQVGDRDTGKDMDNSTLVRDDNRDVDTGAAAAVAAAGGRNLGLVAWQQQSQACYLPMLLLQQLEHWVCYYSKRPPCFW